MKRKPVNILNLILFVDSLLFIILFIILSSNARLASDDFYYLWLKNTYGSWGGMAFQYENWSGRWTAHFAACGLISFWENKYFLTLINLGTLTALYLAIRFSLQKIFNNLKIEAKGVLLPGLSVMLITCFFFATYSIGESWFWYIITITYMWSLICFLFLLNFIFSNTNKYYRISAIPAALFIGGASESFALVFLMILFAIIFYFRKNNDTESREIVKKSTVLIGVIAISFLISFLAPGTDVRRSLLPQTTLTFKGWSFIKTFVKYFIYYIPTHAGYIFLFSFPWLLFGINYLKGKFTPENYRTTIKKTSLAFILILSITFIPTTYVMSEAGPDRAMLLISFLTTIYCAIVFSMAGALIRPIKSFRFITAVVGDISIIVLLVTVYVQAELSSKFADSFDKRIELLHTGKLKHTSGSITVSPLPSPGMLYWEELSSDSTYFTNQHLRKGLDLPFTVITKNK